MVGFNTGKYNVGAYSKRNRVPEVRAAIVQRSLFFARLDYDGIVPVAAVIIQRTPTKVSGTTTNVVSLSAACRQTTPTRVKVEDLSAWIKAACYQSTPVHVRVDALPMASVQARIIQTEPCFVSWHVSPPVDVIGVITQRATFSAIINAYDPETYFGAHFVQNTPVFARAGYVVEVKANVVQNTPIRVTFRFGGVADIAASCVQHTVFKPGVTTNWGPWVPVNPDYPIPWDRERQAA